MGSWVAESAAWGGLLVVGRGVGRGSGVFRNSGWLRPLMVVIAVGFGWEGMLCGCWQCEFRQPGVWGS